MMNSISLDIIIEFLENIFQYFFIKLGFGCIIVYLLNSHSGLELLENLGIFFISYGCLMLLIKNLNEY